MSAQTCTCISAPEVDDSGEVLHASYCMTVMTDRLSPQREAEIAARAEAATPGPWCTDSWEIYQGAEYVPGISYWIGETCRADEDNDGRSDAAFVAHARTDVPALLAELAAVRAERDAFCDRVDTLTAVAKGNKRHVSELFGELQKSQAEVAQWRATFGADALPDALARLRKAEAEAHQYRTALQGAARKADRDRAERDALQQRLHDAAMAKVWKNEDGKKFVFVEDIAPALLGITPGTEAGR